MNKFKKLITVTECATLFLGHLRWMLLFVFLAAQVLPTVAQAQTGRLNACWPAFNYDGKPAQADGSFSKTIVAGSQIETAQLCGRVENDDRRGRKTANSAGLQESTRTSPRRNTPSS